MEHTNEALVAEIQGGASEKTELLWQRFQREVQQQAHLWARRFQARRPGLCAEDLYQCGYIALCHALESYFQSGQVSFASWFLTCLHLEFARAAGHRAVRILDALEQEDSGADLPAPLKHALDTLPEGMRQTLYLRYLFGLSRREAGLLMAIRPGAVAALEEDALRMLREGAQGAVLRQLFDDAFDSAMDT